MHPLCQLSDVSMLLSDANNIYEEVPQYCTVCN